MQTRPPNSISTVQLWFWLLESYDAQGSTTHEEANRKMLRNAVSHLAICDFSWTWYKKSSSEQTA